MKIFFTLIFSLIAPLSWAQRMSLLKTQEKELQTKLDGWWEAPTRFSEDLIKGEVVARADVVGANNLQKMNARVAGLHPRSCERGLKKISRYESYPQHMSFVKEASYDDKTERVRFLLNHTVLPFPMVLAFKIPRITKPGVTHFVFPDGIFAGLHGTIHVAPIGNRCVYFLKADWHGKSTGLPDMIVSTFAQTLIKIGLEHLIRISSL
jgi:hypothetical protein